MLESGIQRRRTGSGRYYRAVCSDVWSLWLRAAGHVPALWHGRSDSIGLGRRQGRRAGHTGGQPRGLSAPSRCRSRRPRRCASCGRLRPKYYRPAHRDRRAAADHIGEVWVGGPHVCKGYWSNPATTRSTFQARIEGEDEFWLRTGDLGFMDEAGELFITGRIKDVIIVRGINYYPQDIENTVYDSHPALRRYCGAVFSVLTENTEEKIVLVQEVERVHRRDLEIDEIIGCIREAVVNEHEIALDSIVLIRPGSIPKTTSGKIQRNLARRMWLQNSFDAVDMLST